MEVLKTLLLVYAAILLINAVFSAFCYYFYHDKLYRYSLYLWVATFANAILEGVFQRTPLAMVLSFSSYFLSALALVQILGFVTRQSFPFRGYWLLMGAGLAGSWIADRSGLEFMWIALPTALGIAFPMLNSAFRAYRATRSDPNRRGIVVYCGLLVINGLHFLDYPFLRLHPDFSVPGFTFALGLLMALSIFLPSFIIKNISDRYTENVSQLNRTLVEYQNQMADLMSLAQVGELSFSFVHDMASPTTLLLHYSKELSNLHRKGVPSGEQILPYSRGIEQATSRLVKLQRMFQAMLRNNLSDEPTSVDLRESIQSCSDLFSPFLKKYQIHLTLRLTPERAEVKSLPGVIERVMLNLIQNATNVLADHESRTLEIALEEAKGGYLIRIRDSGPGIPASRMERLWERFGHSETGKKANGPGLGPRSGGTGFGLYKVKKMIESIQGRIDVETSSSGTEFRILVPLEMSHGLEAGADSIN